MEFVNVTNELSPTLQRLILLTGLLQHKELETFADRNNNLLFGYLPIEFLSAR